MALTWLPWASWILTASLALPLPSRAFDTPLSDSAVRDAYFIGQRHNETTAKFLDKYVKHLLPPKSGPYVSSVALYSPFAQVVIASDLHIGHYSAQQAQIDHRDRRETVVCVVEIQLTDSYPAFIPDPAHNRTNSHPNLVPRPYDFWADVQVHFPNGDEELRPFTSSGRPNVTCSDQGGGCLLTGATLQFEFEASAFPTNEATVQIQPPEGDLLTVNFDLSSVR